ncbi:mitochondrial fission regulator 2 [Nematolebias whitei]|uniref:mitochondrial fission regulator 2 n=1 Tax=Nematolebias whitei TaxID=451745 RepID=UPI001897E0B4|nr:mitochondrial fission regulator 2 [Nematolebias whitei]
MSLVDDILDVLCMVLEYFGVHPDMLVPVWASPLCGPYRSVVRMIGSNLPLAPTPRVHFQIPLVTNRPYGYVDTVDTPAVPSFADVQWVFDDEGESFARTRNHLPPKKTQDLIRNPRLPPTQAQRGGTAVRQKTNPEALQKISELESELLKLRAQIARIVTAAPCSGLTESQNPPGSPLMFPSSAPALTSTPRSAAAPPPPPPPPLPPCITTSTETASVLELIQQRHIKETDAGLQQTRLSKELNNKHLPSMLDVLKDLNQVKLRSVQRSPGGTPARRRRSRRSAALLSDPAALIAEALKKKFAQHRHNVSSDKENSVELSPFGSPESPQVSLHNRRSLGRRHF